MLRYRDVYDVTTLQKSCPLLSRSSPMRMSVFAIARFRAGLPMSSVSTVVAGAMGLIGVTGAAAVPADTPPSQFGVGAPELAPLGQFAVGMRPVHLVQHDQVDAPVFDAGTGMAPRWDRPLIVDVWCPAKSRRARCEWCIGRRYRRSHSRRRRPSPCPAWRCATAAGSGGAGNGFAPYEGERQRRRGDHQE
jgi:hypothetical protein